MKKIFLILLFIFCFFAFNGIYKIDNIMVSGSSIDGSIDGSEDLIECISNSDCPSEIKAYCKDGYQKVKESWYCDLKDGKCRKNIKEEACDYENCTPGRPFIKRCICYGYVCKIESMGFQMGCEMENGVPVCFKRVKTCDTECCGVKNPDGSCNNGSGTHRECINNSIYRVWNGPAGKCDVIPDPQCYFATPPSTKIQDCGGGRAIIVPPSYCCGDNICNDVQRGVCIQSGYDDAKCKQVPAGQVVVALCGPAQQREIQQGCINGLNCKFIVDFPGKCLGQVCNEASVLCANLPNCGGRDPCKGVCQIQQCRQLQSPVCASPNVSRVCVPCDSNNPNNPPDNPNNPPDNPNNPPDNPNNPPDKVPKCDYFDGTCSLLGTSNKECTRDEECRNYFKGGCTPEGTCTPQGTGHNCATDADCNQKAYCNYDNSMCVFGGNSGIPCNYPGSYPEECQNNPLPRITNIKVSPNYCAQMLTGVPGSGLASFMWTYNSPNNLPQSKYQLQISTSKENFENNIIFDSSIKNGQSQSINVIVFNSAANNAGINFGQEYYFRIRVWDSANKTSGWIYYNGNIDGNLNSPPEPIADGTKDINEATPYKYPFSHAGPYVVYDVPPQTPPGTPVLFSDSSICYNDTTSYRCDTLKATESEDGPFCTAAPDRNNDDKRDCYSWWFNKFNERYNRYINNIDMPDGFFIGNTSNVYQNPGTYNTGLQICDELGCCVGIKNVKIGTTEIGNVPKWQEVSPFGN